MKKSILALCSVSLCWTPFFTAAAAPPQEIPHDVTVVDISGDWEAAGDLPRQALLISVQGLANRHDAHIYLTFPDNYKHTDVNAILAYYRTRHGIRTAGAKSAEDIVEKYRRYLKGYVVWDTEVLPSLMVAFTVAGLEDAVVVTESFLPLMQKLGLRQVEDFRNRFSGKTDAQIFQWAYDQYWARCSKDYLVYLGEYCRGLNNRPGMWPVIADFAIVHKAFCTDLSTRPGSGEEYALADRIMSEMNPYAYVYGWHSYCKDQEPEHLTMVSRHALVVAEGLATLPNMSFHANVPVSPGFRFKQRGTFNPDVTVEDKVYITLIQSDGMGIGSWSGPGRGTLPYGWEANEEYFTTAPALLQFYYESATPNDHFIGSLSGPGYFYPKMFPADKLPAVLRREDTLMRAMDLHVFGIMDFSEGDRTVGNADLTKEVADAYYENMPSAVGFLNGYGPANTYDCRDGRPLISYNYYVDIQKSVGEIVEDLQELALLNPRRPYFLPVHVRENNDVDRMNNVVKRLGPGFEVVPPREFMILAGKEPTMTRRYLDRYPDFSGRWKLNREKSRNVIPSSYELEIDHRGKSITITTTALQPRFVHHRELKTAKSLVIGGPPVASPEEFTRRMGYSAGWSDSIMSAADWRPDRKTLIITTSLNLETSQGTAPSTSTSEYSLSDDLMTLTIREWRSTRRSPGQVAIYVFTRVL